MDYTSIKVGQLPTDEISGGNFIPHEVAGVLKKATFTDLAAFIGANDAVGFRAVSVQNGGTLPTTTTQEFILVGAGTYNNVGGGSSITVTEQLNALVSNGTYWFVGVEIPIEAPPGNAIWGQIIGTLSQQTDLQNLFNLKADLVDGKVPSSQLPSYVDDVVEVANYAALPVSGETGKIYVTLDNNKIFRWSGSTYIEIAENNAVWGAITGTLANQTDLQNALDTKQDDLVSGTNIKTIEGQSLLGSGNIDLTKSDVGLSNVDNTSDANKPVSTAQQTALNLKLPYTGATGNVDLGSHKLTASDLVINHASGSGVAASITKGGNGEALTVTKSSGSGNAASVLGGITLLDELHLNTYLADTYIASAATWNAKQTALNGTGFVKISGTTISYDNSAYALDSSVVKVTTNQNIRGIKTFLGDQTATTLKLIVADYYNDGFITSDNGMLRLLNGSTELFNLASTGDLTAKSFVKSGGTSSQFLKANGSVDSNTYATTSQLHDAVTIGTANGLSLSAQALSLSLASTSANGALSSTDWNTFNGKQSALSGSGIVKSTGGTISYLTDNSSNWDSAYNDKINSAAVTGTSTKTLTLTQQDGGTLTASWTDINSDVVTSVFGRTGDIVAANGDYTTTQVTEGTNLYYTEARVNANTNVAANTAARHSAVTIGTANGLSLSTQALSLGLASASANGALSSTDWSTFNGKQAALSGTGFVKISGSTISYDNSTYLTSITSTNVTDALGFTPYNATNPSGYITTAGRAFPKRANGTNINFNIENGIVSTDNVTTILGTTDNINFQVYSTANLNIGGNAATATTATTANSVAWTNVSGRPTNVSSFTNDSAYITSSGSITGSAGSAFGMPNGGNEISGMGPITNWDSRPGVGMAGFGINWHTGVSISGYPGYGGVRLYASGYPTHSSSVLRLEASDSVKTYGILYNNESVRSPIFYDSNDTGYYCDPTGTSIFAGLTITGGRPITTDSSGGGIYIKGSTGGWATGYYFNGSSNTYRGGFGALGDADGLSNYWIGPAYNNYYTYIDSSQLYHTNSVRSPIFYDSNDTGRYIDPASTSNLQNIGLNGYINFNGSGTTVRISESYGILMNCVSTPWNVQMINTSLLVGLSASGGNYGNGNGYFTGDVTAYYSDKRLKHNLVLINNAIDKVKLLNGYTYQHNELGQKLLNENAYKNHAGLIAQEVQAVLPEVVTIAPFDLDGFDENGNGISKSGENYLTIKYERIVPLLIEAIKEQQIQIEELKKLIKK